jgi:uncharacterized membrane protein
MTKITLHDIGSRVNNIYDTGFEDMDATTPEEEEMKKSMAKKAKQQEKVEMIVVGVVLSVLAAVIVWAGMGLWAFITSPAVGIIAAIIAFLILAFKLTVSALTIGLPIAFSIMAYMKAKGA